MVGKLLTIIANFLSYRGGGGRVGLERWTVDQVVLGSNHASATSLRNLGNYFFFTPLCQCLSEEAVVPFYLVSMPGEVIDPTTLTALEMCNSSRTPHSSPEKGYSKPLLC